MYLPATFASHHSRFLDRLTRRAGPALLAALLSLSQAACAALPAQSGVEQPARRADFSGQKPSADTRRLAEWVVASNDNQGLPFVIVDKRAAEMLMFDPRGKVSAATTILLGRAVGDDSPPGIGNKPLSQIAPAERITPAGRFLAWQGKNPHGQDIVWIDYGAAVALHRATDVVPNVARDRLARLASTSPRAKRVTLGCLNVSTEFYDRYVRPTFRGTKGVFYILPETRPAGDTFPMLASNRTVASQTP
jgi:hypothetical protein